MCRSCFHTAEADSATVLKSLLVFMLLDSFMNQTRLCLYIAPCLKSVLISTQLWWLSTSVCSKMAHLPKLHSLVINRLIRLITSSLVYVAVVFRVKYRLAEHVCSRMWGLLIRPLQVPPPNLCRIWQHMLGAPGAGKVRVLISDCMHRAQNQIHTCKLWLYTYILEKKSLGQLRTYTYVGEL